MKNRFTIWLCIMIPASILFSFIFLHFFTNKLHKGVVISKTLYSSSATFDAVPPRRYHCYPAYISVEVKGLYNTKEVREHHEFDSTEYNKINVGQSYFFDTLAGGRWVADK